MKQKYHYTFSIREKFIGILACQALSFENSIFQWDFLEGAEDSLHGTRTYEGFHAHLLVAAHGDESRVLKQNSDLANLYETLNRKLRMEEKTILRIRAEIAEGEITHLVI